MRPCPGRCSHDTRSHPQPRHGRQSGSLRLDAIHSLTHAFQAHVTLEEKAGAESGLWQERHYRRGGVSPQIYREACDSVRHIAGWVCARPVSEIHADEVNRIGEAEQLLPHLMQFSEGHRAEARSLQTEIDAFTAELEAVINEVWPHKAEQMDEAGNPLPSTTTTSWAERMEEKRRQRQDAVQRIEKPEPSKVGWRVNVLDL